MLGKTYVRKSKSKIKSKSDHELGESFICRRRQLKITDFDSIAGLRIEFKTGRYHYLFFFRCFSF